MSYWMPSDSQWVEDLFPLMSYWMPTTKITDANHQKKMRPSLHGSLKWMYSAGLGTIILMFGFWEIQSINVFHKSKPEAFHNPRNLEQRMSFSQPTHSLSQLISFSRSYSSNSRKPSFTCDFPTVWQLWSSEKRPCFQRHHTVFRWCMRFGVASCQIWLTRHERAS